ncbi:alpha/beta hydrolase [Streptomyces sp. SID3343]|uniref:alpha/beta fold hydrolase n=1 Tax=Streptomyces sp. SID3343 TaxID=2690260 RepID=UPI001369A644|nr:alpha/beta hydrolase [Streptomyces sp. SID3343]MYV97981.1 alpha/beta fold hydrolase [Streptomyces sp. SID3343]
MANIFLVPGYWLGAWAWDLVADRLRAAGHEVTAVTLLGLEADRTDVAGIDLAAQTRGLVESITSRGLTDVVLVGHSGGAFAAYETLDRIPDRIARIVYVDSGPVPVGTAQLDVVDPAERARVEAEVAERGDGRYTYAYDPTHDPEALAGLSDADLATLRARSVPQPYAVAASALDVRDPDRLKVPADLITCTFSIEQVDAMISAGHPFFAEFVGAESFHTHALPTGHWPMFSRPADLAALIGDIAG